ncbi:hypothetical protein [uncultured Cohaesibacter sp.]|uniref:hypothetical protein n=1 Tax=uncultured Cohaesibacter sp. TaxID=1002546 RepID=UPI0029C8733E|nr:hypothetical protein [uncultured Cohaesibacter sp.]
MQGMQAMGTVIAMHGAHFRGRKNHLLAMGASKFLLTYLPSFAFMLLFLAIDISIGAERLPPEIAFVVKHEVLPSIFEEMIGQKKISK